VVGAGGVAWGWVADAGGEEESRREVGARGWLAIEEEIRWSEKKMIFQISTTHLRSDGPKIRTRRGSISPV
jgi:hypothetical protein